ncbi:MAG: hypothetical protein A2W25_01440 [candidate division Zixibacteria bacterium RBG_16_53_22]|nr:MAG: hypothetical protein A2W25_01440 [candidate division Zixibacteria bacterium RBG_16_53_22]
MTTGNNFVPPGFRKPTFNPVQVFDLATRDLADALSMIEHKHGNMEEVAFIRGSVYSMLIEFGIPIRFAARLLKRYPL